ncbi:MAG: S8 family peptidase [Chloroflexota bacterium]|nr:S8 family peptidase [Chloroflexota bacterium]
MHVQRWQPTRYRLAFLLLVLAVLIAATAAPTPATAQRPEREVPVPVIEGAGELIKDQYIAVFKDNTVDAGPLATRLVQAHGGELLRSYEHALKGFAARLVPEGVEALERNSHVAFIEPDRIVSILDTQSPATWGIDRLDQRNLPLSNSYTYDASGAGVNVYVIDTGIHLSHSEFGGRAVSGFDAVDGGSADDCHGHGTHVAGTIAGGTYGVAKNAKVHAVRVLGCKGLGQLSNILAGLDWVTAHHVKPAVANMSLGGKGSKAIDYAVHNSIHAGITFAVAAGNSDRNACFFSPARVPSAITVGASDSSDARSSFSNWGRCVDIFAPGSEITSAWNTASDAVATYSGTSMATPHVAGVAALYLERNRDASPSEVRNALVNNATSGALSNLRGQSPNLLLYSPFTD